MLPSKVPNVPKINPFAVLGVIVPRAKLPGQVSVPVEAVEYLSKATGVAAFTTS